MNGKRSLRQVLARQWIAFALVLATAFAAMALLLLFILEDEFIDDRLGSVAGGIVRLESARLPERFELHPLLRAPDELVLPMQGRRPGAIDEFRLDDGRYVHVLLGRSPAGEDYLLVYDVSDQLRVNQALAGAWPWLLAMAAALAALAWLLSRWLVARIARRARGLVERIGGSPDPASLRAFAEHEKIAEFSQLALWAADSWKARLHALAVERETLAFLGHELRTPLQSARTSLALLQDDRDNEEAWKRLQRAQNRLLRASHSVLWLASDAGPPARFGKNARAASGASPSPNVLATSNSRRVSRGPSSTPSSYPGDVQPGGKITDKGAVRPPSLAITSAPSRAAGNRISLTLLDTLANHFSSLLGIGKFKYPDWTIP